MRLTRRPARPKLATRRWVPVLNILICIPALVIILMSGGRFQYAAELGASPIHTEAIQVTGCDRCDSIVTYDTGAGHLVTTLLMGDVGGGATFGPDVPIVYSPTDPHLVMTQSEWESGRSTEMIAMYHGLIAALAVWIGAALLLTARRRRKFGHMRPGTSLLALQWKPGNRKIPDQWRVTFADNTHAAYIDSPTTRDELRTRVSSKLLAADEQARTVLTL